MDQKLFEELAETDPTPVHKTRWGTETRKLQYMDWLIAEYTHAIHTGSILPLDKPFLRGLLWVHSRLAGMKGIDENLKLKNDSGYITSEQLYDLIVNALLPIIQNAPQVALNMYKNYPRNCDALVGRLLLPSDPAIEKWRRQEVMREIAKGKDGRFAYLMKAGYAGIIPLEIVYCRPGVMSIARCNTQEAQQAISGDEKTKWCIALKGDQGKNFFASYEVEGGLYSGQFTLMFDASGEMYAATSRYLSHTDAQEAQISIENSANETTSLQSLILEETISNPKIREFFPHAALAMIASCMAYKPDGSHPPQSKKARETRLRTARAIIYGTLIVMGNETAKIMSSNISSILENSISDMIHNKEDQLYFLMPLFRDCPALLDHQTSETFIKVIAHMLTDCDPLNASDTLKYTQARQELFAEIMKDLPDRITFAPSHEGHGPGELLRAFSDFPELHQKIHEFGIGCNTFAQLLPDAPRDRPGLIPATEVELTDNGFRIDGRLAKVVIANWVQMGATNREHHINYDIPVIAGLMKRGAQETTTPLLRAVAEREIRDLRTFLKPRGIEI